VALIKKLNKSLGLTSVVVSHDIHETFSIADYVCILSEGKVAAAGSPAELLQSDSEFVQQFVKGKPDGPMPFHYPSRQYSEDLLNGVSGA